MDEKDIEIIEKLKDDASKSINAIAKEIGLPRSTVYDKIKRLREDGVIKKFTIVPDYSKLGTPVTAFILAKYIHSKRDTQRKVAEEIAKLPGVYEVHLISGQWDILIKARGESIEDIGRLTIDFLGEMDSIGERITCTSFAAIKEEL